MSTPRIRDLRALLFRAPLEQDFEFAFGRMDVRQCLVLAVTLDDGRTGFGECWASWPTWAPEERMLLLERGVAPWLVGREIDGDGALLAELHAGLEGQYRQAGSPGPLWHVISAIDQAFCDLLNDPVPLGAEVEVYGSGLGPTGVVEDAIRVSGHGFRTLKVRIGFGEGTDLGNLRALRGVVDDDMVIVVDANQHFDLQGAVAIAPSLQELGVSWIEEPIARDEVGDLRRLHEETGIRIATGENLYHLEEFERRAELPGVVVLQPDVTKLGGITRTRRLIDRLAPYDVEVVPHMYGGPVGLAATLRLAHDCPEVRMVEYDLRPNPLAVMPTPVDGRLRLFPDHAAAVATMVGSPYEERRLLAPDSRSRAGS